MISRAHILGKLDEWSTGKLNPEQMQQWAAGLLAQEDLDFDDWENGGTQSAAKEALTELEMLDMNMITAGDAPVFVKFLESSAGEFGPAYIKFIESLDEIDAPKRMKALRDIEPYRRHCK